MGRSGERNLAWSEQSHRLMKPQPISGIGAAKQVLTKAAAISVRFKPGYKDQAHVLYSQKSRPKFNAIARPKKNALSHGTWMTAFRIAMRVDTTAPQFIVRSVKMPDTADKTTAPAPVDAYGFLEEGAIDIEMLSSRATAAACARGRPIWKFRVVPIGIESEGDDDFTRILMGRT